MVTNMKDRDQGLETEMCVSIALSFANGNMNTEFEPQGGTFKIPVGQPLNGIHLSNDWRCKYSGRPRA